MALDQFGVPFRRRLVIPLRPEGSNGACSFAVCPAGDLDRGGLLGGSSHVGLRPTATGRLHGRL